eukprot:6556022-Prymnesium_polylepis.1
MAFSLKKFPARYAKVAPPPLAPPLSRSSSSERLSVSRARSPRLALMRVPFRPSLTLALPLSPPDRPLCLHRSGVQAFRAASPS